MWQFFITCFFKVWSSDLGKRCHEFRSVDDAFGYPMSLSVSLDGVYTAVGFQYGHIQMYSSMSGRYFYVYWYLIIIEYILSNNNNNDKYPISNADLGPLKSISNPCSVLMPANVPIFSGFPLFLFFGTIFVNHPEPLRNFLTKK